MTWAVIEALVVLSATALDTDLVMILAIREAVNVIIFAIVFTPSHFFAGMLNTILIDVVVTELIVVCVPWAVTSVDAVGVTRAFLFTAVFGQFTSVKTGFVATIARFLAVNILVVTVFHALLDFWLPEIVAMAIFVWLHDGVVFTPNNSW